MDRYYKLTLYFLILSHLVSIFGITINIDHPDYFRFAGYFIPASFGLLMLFHKSHTLRFWLALLACGLLGFLVEVLGTNTGLVFGSYSYGNSLGAKLWGTPLVMAVNWMMLPYMVMVLVSKWQWGYCYKVAGSALVLTGYDLLIEPVAIRLDMWAWESGHNSIHNSIGWFVVSLAIFGVLYKSKIDVQNRLAPKLFVIQGVFFLTLSLVFA
jgi:putative membrane protein